MLNYNKPHLLVAVCAFVLANKVAIHQTRLLLG